MSAIRYLSLSMILLQTASALADGPELSAAPANPAPHEALSLSRAVEIALERNPGAKVTHEKLNELDADVSTAKAQLFPTFGLSGGVLEKKDPVTNPYALFGGTPYNYYTFGAQVTQPIWESGLLSGGIDLVKSNKAIGELNDDITRRTLVLGVIQAFYSIILYQRTLSSLEKERTVDDELIKTINKYYHVGRNQLLDVLQEEAQVAALVPQIAQAKNQIQISATQLATYLGDRNVAEIEVLGTLDMPDRKALEDDMKTQKLRVYENELVDEQLKMVDYNRAVGLAGNYPSLSAIGTFGRTAYVKTDLLNDDATSWSFGVQLTIPIFTGLSSVYQRHMYNSQEAQASINRSGQYDQTVLTQVQSLRNLDIAQDTVNTSALSYKIAQDSMKEATRTMRLGTINLLQYQSSEQALFAAEVALDQSKYTFIADLSQYVIAMGYPYQELVKHLENKP